MTIPMKQWLFLIVILFPNLLLADRLNPDSLKNELENTRVDTSKVKLLILLWESTAYTEPETAKTYAEKALELSQNNHYKKGIAEAYQRLAAGYTVQNVPDTALDLYQRALFLYKELNDTKMEANILSNIGIIYYEQGEYIQAMFNTEESLRISSKVNDLHGIALSLQLLGNINYYMGNFDEAQKYHMQSIQKLLDLGDDIRYADGLVYMASTYQALKKYRKALENLKKACAIYEEKDDRFFLAQALNNTGYIYMIMTKYDSAKIYLSKAIILADEIGNNNVILLANNTLGVISKEEGDYTKANAYFENAFKLAIKHNDQLRMSMLYRNFGDLYAAEKQFNKAMNAYDSAVVIANKVESKPSLKEAYESISDAWADQGNYKKSLEYYVLYAAMKDSILDKEKSDKIEELEARYRKIEDEKEIAVQKSQIEILSKDLELQRIRQLILIAGLILSLIIAIYFVFHLRSKMRRNRLIREQEKLLENEKLINAELQRDNYEKELAIKKNELTSHALQMVQKNELLESLKEKIAELEAQSKSENKSDFRKLRGMINGSAQTDKEWTNFNRHFEQVHQGFLSKLKNEFPVLTSNDLRLSAMLKLNLSSKEVASIMNISPESVKKARYRLRKKLQLPDESDLHSFMMTMEN